MQINLRFLSSLWGFKHYYGFLLVHQHSVFVGEEMAVAGYPELVDVLVALGGIDVAALDIVGQEDGVGFDVGEEPAEDFDLVKAVVVHAGAYFLYAELGFRDVDVSVLMAAQGPKYIEVNLARDFQEPCLDHRGVGGCGYVYLYNSLHM